MHENRDTTELLAQLTGDDSSVLDALTPRIYDELHALAHRQLRRERSNHTLNTTALVHEAYLKLVDQNRASLQNRVHFFAIASLAIRRILINYANKRSAQKRGGDLIRTTFDEGQIVREGKTEELLALDEALQRLEGMNERQSLVVTYRFFGGLTHQEIAEVLDVSVPTVRRDWRLARAWLSRQMRVDV